MTKYKIWFAFFVWVAIGTGTALEAMPLESLLPPSLPEGWVLIEGPRLYAKKTLFEHVDGQAELYFKYGYQRSVFAIYQNQKKSENQIELDICDMGNVLQAFGIFSRFRTEDPAGGIGLDACIGDRSILFYKGSYFVMLYGTESNPSAMKELALAVSSRISDSSPPPKEIGFFPLKGLRPGSIQYFSEGLLGHQFLKRGFQGTYVSENKEEVKPKAKAEDRTKADGQDKVENKTQTGAEEQQKEFTLFLAIFKSREEAKSALRTYKNYLVKKGKVQPKIPSGYGLGAFIGEDPYKGNVLIVQRGGCLVGIVDYENEREARDRVGEMIGNIK